MTDIFLGTSVPGNSFGLSDNEKNALTDVSGYELLNVAADVSRRIWRFTAGGIMIKSVISGLFLPVRASRLIGLEFYSCLVP